MSGKSPVPEDAFRVEGHCCAASLPGIREGDTAVDFAAGEEVREYLAAAWGLGRNTETPDEGKDEAGGRPDGRPG
jgi:hypothetical protein